MKDLSDIADTVYHGLYLSNDQYGFVLIHSIDEDSGDSIIDLLKIDEAKLHRFEFSEERLDLIQEILKIRSDIEYRFALFCRFGEKVYYSDDAEELLKRYYIMSKI